ncbi:MAG: GerAB/ArcD/ProY family transporter [Bacteroidota bacterium]
MAKNKAPIGTGHLGHRETIALLIIAIASRLFLGLPRIMATVGGTAGWLVVTIAFGAALLGFLLLDLLLARFPGDDLLGIARRIVGPFAPAVGLILFLFLLATVSLVTREFAEIFIVGILPRTPIGVVGGLLLVLLVFASYMGLETISRLAILYAPYLLLFLSLIYVLVLPNASLLNLAPLWGSGLSRMALPGLARSAVFAEIVLLGFFAPQLRETRRRRTVGFLSLVGSYLIFLVTTLVYSMVFDYPGTTGIFFPVFQMARLISIVEFIQRIEAVFIFIWFFSAVIGMAAVFFTAAYIYARTFGLATHRPLLFPLAVVVYGLSLLPGSFSTAVRLDADYVRLYAWGPAFVLPGVLLILAVLRGQKGTNAH